MIGTSTHIRNSQRVLYPSMSICPLSWRDPIFNYDLLEDHGILGVPLTETKGFKIASPIHKIAKEIDYFRRVNNTRYQQAMIHLQRNFNLYLFSQDRREVVRFSSIWNLNEDRYPVSTNYVKINDL